MRGELSQFLNAINHNNDGEMARSRANDHSNYLALAAKSLKWQETTNVWEKRTKKNV